MRSIKATNHFVFAVTALTLIFCPYSDAPMRALAADALTDAVQQAHFGGISGGGVRFLFRPSIGLSWRCAKAGAVCYEPGDTVIVPSGYQICKAQMHKRNGFKFTGGTLDFSLANNNHAIVYHSYWGTNQTKQINMEFAVRPEGAIDSSCMKDGPLWDCTTERCQEHQSGAVVD